MVGRIILGAMVFASLMGAQEGHWEGSFTAGNREIGVSLDLAKNAKAEWIASMGVPAQNATGLVVKDLTVDGKRVKFMAVELAMALFDLTVGEDGGMKGTLSGRMGVVPVALKRTGEAKVELMAASPAVSKELEGDWDGSLETPGGAMPLVFHFKNLPDHTVAATIDTPNSTSMPLNDVKQTGQKVAFGMKIAGGSFEGTLNGNEIKGQLIHDGNPMAMTLKKK